jgi:hypothetical protein
MKYLIIIIALCSVTISFAQLGISSHSTHASAALDLNSSTKGFKASSIALTSNLDVTTIPNPAIGLLIYNTATVGVFPNNLIPGYYFFNSANIWEPLALNDALNINVQSSNYTLTNDDLNKVVIINSNVSTSLTVPSSLPTGFKCRLLLIGNGVVDVVGGSGVSVNSSNGKKIRLQNRSVQLLKNSTSSAYLSGAISY